jgi:hypothetical protein
VAQGIRLPYPDPVTAAETIARNSAANYFNVAGCDTQTPKSTPFVERRSRGTD